MQPMTKEETKEFLMAGTRTGKIASVRGDGRPHVAPIWFVVDGDDLVFTTWHTTVKAANIRRDPRVSLCVDDQAPPYSFVIVEGVATLHDDLEELAHWARVIGARYMGEDQAEAFGKRNAVKGELVVRLRPTKIIATKEMAA
jgi:PPOX class probable F420-dependent enzyme